MASDYVRGSEPPALQRSVCRAARSQSHSVFQRVWAGFVHPTHEKLHKLQPFRTSSAQI